MTPLTTTSTYRIAPTTRSDGSNGYVAEVTETTRDEGGKLRNRENRVLGIFVSRREARDYVQLLGGQA